MSIRNSVTLIGNVGQLPTSKTLPSGTRIIEFSLATNESYRNREGEKITRTEWHRVKAYGSKLVEVLERYLTTGTKLVVVGSLRYGKWVDKFDQNRSTTEIILEEFTFLGSKDKDGSSYSTADNDGEGMMVAEAVPTKKTSKRRSGKVAAKAITPAEMTAAEDLPF